MPRKNNQNNREKNHFNKSASNHTINPQEPINKTHPAIQNKQAPKTNNGDLNDLQYQKKQLTKEKSKISKKLKQNMHNLDSLKTEHSKLNETIANRIADLTTEQDNLKIEMQNKKRNEEALNKKKRELYRNQKQNEPDRHLLVEKERELAVQLAQYDKELNEFETLKKEHNILVVLRQHISKNQKNNYVNSQKEHYENRFKVKICSLFFFFI